MARLVTCPGAGAGGTLEPKPDRWTRFVCFSDTHGLHDSIPRVHRPEADVLLHGGDFTNTGELEQIESFSKWLRAYPAGEKVVIAGNHDVTFQEEYYERAWARFHPFSRYNSRECRSALSHCTYLEDTEAEVCGYRIYGSPWQPEFCDWAFNLKRGAACRATWEAIPPRPDILMTHGPPKGICDRCSDGFLAGCEELVDAIQQRSVPISVFGHIHEAYGTVRRGATLFINASTCTLSYRPTHPPIVFDLPPPEEFRRAGVVGDLGAHSSRTMSGTRTSTRGAAATPAIPDGGGV